MSTNERVRATVSSLKEEVLDWSGYHDDRIRFTGLTISAGAALSFIGFTGRFLYMQSLFLIPIMILTSVVGTILLGVAVVLSVQYGPHSVRAEVVIEVDTGRCYVEQTRARTSDMTTTIILMYSTVAVCGILFAVAYILR